MPGVIKYFAYGSNLHPVRLQQRVPSCRFLDVAKLSGYQLKFHKLHPDGSGKCSVLFTGDEQHHLFGVVYSISASDKSLLDRAEGVGHGYDVTELSLTGNTGAHTAFTYVANDDYIDDSLQPYPWYKALVVTGATRHQLPDDYIARLELVDTIDDADEQRIDLHMEIVKTEML